MTSQANTKLNCFLSATSAVYGPLKDLTPATAPSWSPPSSPGAGGHRGRYLWTDAFGVVNFLTLHHQTGGGDPTYLTLARRLADTVHDVLGRARDGSGARLPGATDRAPLAGGLRIGKKAAPGEPDGDGQYHHYLTLWMFALARLAWALGGSSDGKREEGRRYAELAVRLGRAIHPRFVRGNGDGDGGMVWKVSTDMEMVLVPSEGHLDAATGFVVYRLVQEVAERMGVPRAQETDDRAGEGGRLLQREIEDYRRLMTRKGALKASRDPLDLSMGLWVCHFFRDEAWAAQLGEESMSRAAQALGPDGVMGRHAGSRLAFREFGACLGVQCYGPDEELQAKVDKVIEFWEGYLEGDSADEEDLRPISLVMYAAALIPGGKQASQFWGRKAMVPISTSKFLVFDYVY